MVLWSGMVWLKTMRVRLHDNFVQNEGEDGQLQQKPRYEHGSESDDSDYELYDEENDVAIEDDHLFDDTVVLTTWLH